MCLYSVPSVPPSLRLCLLSKQDTWHMDFRGGRLRWHPCSGEVGKGLWGSLCVRAPLYCYVGGADRKARYTETKPASFSHLEL